VFNKMDDWKKYTLVGLLAVAALVFVVLYAIKITTARSDNIDNIRFTSRTVVEQVTDPVKLTVLMQTDGNSTSGKATWPLDPATTSIENLRMYVTDNASSEPISDLGTYLTDGNDTRIREAFRPETVVTPTAEDALGLTAKYHADVSITSSSNAAKTLQVYGRVKTDDGSYLLVHTTVGLVNPSNGVWVNVSIGFLGVYTSDLKVSDQHPETMGVVFTSIH